LDTKEVPDFAAIHEREKQRLEQKKFQNRFVTTPAPFKLHVPSRRRFRQEPLPKDLSNDWRWNQPGKANYARRPASAGSRFSVRALERPSIVAPPRTTEKTLQQLQHTQRILQERRERELREREELEQARAGHPPGGGGGELDYQRLREEVREAVGPMEPLEERIGRMVATKRRARQRVVQEKRRALQEIQERVRSKPLLMQQEDTLVRARRHALMRVRATLEDAGVREVDSHFQEEELDELAGQR
jgi:hypothetical protein